MTKQDVSKIQATPAAEEKAVELGVDLGKIEGSGAGEKVTVQDVEASAAEPEKLFELKINPALGGVLSVRIGDEVFTGGEHRTESEFEELKKARDVSGRLQLIQKSKEVS